MFRIERIADRQDIAFNIAAFSINGVSLSFLSYDWDLTLQSNSDVVCKIARRGGNVGSVGHVPASVAVTAEVLTVFARASEKPFGLGRIKYQFTLMKPSDTIPGGVQVLKTLTGYTLCEIARDGQAYLPGSVQVDVKIPVILSEATAEAVAETRAATQRATAAAAAAEAAAAHQPYIGDNRHWYVWSVAAGEFVDTGVVAEGAPGAPGPGGPQGPKGDDGADGSDGAPGITPHIDATTGNWFIGDIDTGVHAQGPKGEDGSFPEPPADGQLYGRTRNSGQTEGAWRKVSGNVPYLSLERLRPYLYRVTFDSIPEDNGADAAMPTGCSSYVKDGKLFRNLDFYYDNAASFIVRTKDFEGMSFITGLNDGALNDDMIAQLPYRMVDGRNNHGIMVSAHVLFNDWDWTGAGNRSISLTRLPFLVLTRVKSMATIAADLTGILGNLVAPEAMGDYLLQVLITDGTTTYALMPPTADNQAYVLQDISSNPKLANFRWVNRSTVVRTEADIQRRPTGIERWNAMPCPLEDLRFTKAYESDERLSEFIGIDETTKASTDAELEAIYARARAIYLDRARDGQTWQTMHSIVYGDKMEGLWIQENWNDNCIALSGGGATFVPMVMPDSTQEEIKAFYDAFKSASDNSVFVTDIVGYKYICNDYAITENEVLATFIANLVGVLVAVQKSDDTYTVALQQVEYNYADLTNRPKINNVELNGNKTAGDLGLAEPTAKVSATVTGLTISENLNENEMKVIDTTSLTGDVVLNVTPIIPTDASLREIIYAVRVKVGANVTAVAFGVPSDYTVVWNGGNNPSWTAGKTYEVIMSINGTELDACFGEF